MNFRPTHALILGLALSLQLAASACSTPGPKPDPVEQAFSESREVIITGVEEGFEESESVDEYVVYARLNPCRCESPHHEVYAHGRWTRVFLEGDEALIAEIDEKLSRREGEFDLATLALKGRLDGEESTSQGIKYLVFEVVEVEPEDEQL